MILVEEISELVKILNQRSIFIFDEEDKLICSFKKSGKYSVKDGYSSLLNGMYSTKSREFSLCWHDLVFPMNVQLKLWTVLVGLVQFIGHSLNG